jgi:hypothetical protein
MSFGPEQQKDLLYFDRFFLRYLSLAKRVFKIDKESIRSMDDSYAPLCRTYRQESPGKKLVKAFFIG